MSADLRHFEVQLSAPYTRDSDGHTYNANYTLNVLTTDAQRAIFLALDKHPQGTVHQVICRNRTNLILDPAIVGARL